AVYAIARERRARAGRDLVQQDLLEQVERRLRKRDVTAVRRPREVFDAFAIRREQLGGVRRHVEQPCIVVVVGVDDPLAVGRRHAAEAQALAVGREAPFPTDTVYRKLRVLELATRIREAE